MKKTKSRMTTALKTFLLVTVIFGDRSFLQPALASKEPKEQHKSKQTESVKAPGLSSEVDPALGVNGATLTLINEGKWQEAATSLEAQTSGSKTAGKKEAWLAFAYLYLNNCAKLSAMNDLMGAAPSVKAVGSDKAAVAVVGSVPIAVPSTSGEAKSTKETVVVGADVTDRAARAVLSGANDPGKISNVDLTSASRYSLVISAFEKVCEGRRDDALTVIQQLPTDAANDPICVFAQAAIASKRGMVADAANLCLRVVALSPNFAWGYRTLGFLQQISLKRPADAEVSYQRALQIEPDLDAVRRNLIQMKVARNDYDGAIELAKVAIAMHPQDASPHYQLADEIYIKQWRLLEASAQLDDAIRYDAGNAKYYRAQAAVKRLQGDLPGALAAQNMAVKLGSDKAFELVELASLEQMSGNNARAVEDLEQSIALDSSNTLAHEKLISLLEAGQRYDELVAEYARLLKDKPKDAKLHLRLAKALASTNKIEEAEKEYVEAANLDPGDAEPHRQMGLLKIRLGQFGAAAKEYTRALNINPSSVPDLVSLGYCYAENDDYMQAEAAYVTALALQQLLVQSTDITPDRLDIMRSLAVLLMHETRYSDAASQFESIVAMGKPGADQGLDQFMLARARAMRDRTADSGYAMQNAFDKLDAQKQSDQDLWLVDTFLKMNRPELAKSLIEKHANDPADSDAQCSWLLSVGRYDFATNNSDTAKAVLQKVIDSKTASTSLKSKAMRVIGEAAYTAGDYGAAEKSVRSAIDIYPKNFDAQIVAGLVALKNKDPKLASDFAKKSLETNPYDARAQIVMGLAQTQLGDLKAAADHFRKATALYPALPEAHKLLSETLTKQTLTAEARKERELAASLEAKEK